MRTPLLLLALAALCAGCPSTTRFHTPAGRLTDHTAYTLPPGEVKLGVGLVGTTIEDVGASIPVEVGLPAGFQIGTNAAHDVVALVNVTAKWNPLDTKHAALGVQAGFKWFNPSNLWLLPDDVREELGSLDLFIIPVWVIGTFPVVDWFDATLGIGYTHSEASGEYATGSALADGYVAAREITLHPRLSFYPGDVVAIVVGAWVPVWARAVASAAAEVEVQPGVIAGFDDTEYRRLDVRGLVTPYVAAELRWGVTRLRLGANWGMRFLTKRLEIPLPTLDLYWRF